MGGSGSGETAKTTLGDLFDQRQDPILALDRAFRSGLTVTRLSRSTIMRANACAFTRCRSALCAQADALGLPNELDLRLLMRLPDDPRAGIRPRPQRRLGSWADVGIAHLGILCPTDRCFREALLRCTA